MPIRYQAFIKDDDKKENKILSDIIVTGSSKGEVSFISKGGEFIMLESPLKDHIANQDFGLIATLLKVEDDSLKLFDCDLTIGAKPSKLHLLERLPASGPANEHYLAEAAEFHTPPFVIETVNRYAVWDEVLVGKTVDVGLSAFPFKIVVHDDIDSFNKQFDIFPIETKNGTVSGFTEDFVAPKDLESTSPYTFFLGKVLDIKNVKAKFIYNKINLSIIYVDCFLGVLKVVAGKDKFALDNLEKGKLLEISADIKADFGVCPSPEALIKKETEEDKKSKRKRRSFFRKGPWMTYNGAQGKKKLSKHSSGTSTKKLPENESGNK